LRTSGLDNQLAITQLQQQGVIAAVAGVVCQYALAVVAALAAGVVPHAAHVAIGGDEWRAVRGASLAEKFAIALYRRGAAAGGGVGYQAVAVVVAPPLVKAERT